MGTCLLTQLKDSVSDDSLLKLGEFYFYPIKGNAVHHDVATNQSVTMTIEGDGYFTDSTGVSNYGKTTTINGRSGVYVKNNNGDVKVKFSNKYALTYAGMINDTVNAEDLCGVSVSLLAVKVDGDIKYAIGTNADQINMPNSVNATGSIDSIASHTGNITQFWLYGAPKVTGSIESFGDKVTLTNLSLSNLPRVTGSFASLSGLVNLEYLYIGSNENTSGNISFITTMPNLKRLDADNVPNLTGNISAISGMTNLEHLSINNDPIGGLLRSVSGLTSLKTLRISNTNITGDTSDLAGLTNLTTFVYTNTAITGTWPLT